MDDQHPVGSVVVETHISRLFLTPTRVFKILKPLALPFVDWTDTPTRLDAAEREVELNRRFAPDVYLGTADVHEGGELVDRMIVMRRLPAARCLAALVNGPHFEDAVLEVARRVACIHAGAAPVIPAPTATIEAVGRNWSDNFASLATMVGDIVEPSDHEMAHSLVAAYLAGRDQLFDDRIADGFVRDGHGDLTAADIFCLDSGVELLDCVAFDDGLRVGDVLSDAAFLAMDLHRLAGPDSARCFLAHYQRLTNEQHPASLGHHYIAYRAHVRAKVAGLRAQQGDPTGQAEARTYHELAVHHLRRAHIRAIVIGGNGAGRTRLAGAIADHYGYVLLSVDDVRRDAGRPQADLLAQATVENDDRELSRRTEALLRRGHGVVVEAPWSRGRSRAAVRAVARTCSAQLVEFVCPDPSEERLRTARHVHAPGPSSVGLDGGAFDTWPEAIPMLPGPSGVVDVAAAVSAIEATWDVPERV